MDKESWLSIVTQSKRGNACHAPKEYGLVEVYLGGVGFVSFDAFKGYGETYTRREETQIRIVSNENEEVFKGTLDELVNKLKKG